MDLSEIDARMQIDQALVRFARGVDRVDLTLLLSAFHEDAMLNYAGNDVTVADWARALIERRSGATQPSMHHLTNSLVEFVSTDEAHVETYVLGFGPHRRDETRLGLMSGRYLDRFAPRNGQWRVAQRTNIVSDYSWSEIAGRANSPTTFAVGSVGTTDVSYELFTDLNDREPSDRR
jgi:hypothetical protein